MKRLLLLLLTLLVCAASFAQRPKVGLVLSGGGAKGAAHIGVLKVLEENDIPIDYIAGTSMGAIIGGLYAMGYKADDIDSLISDQDWPFVMSDNVKERNISFEDRRFAGKYPLRIPFTINFDTPPQKERDLDTLIGPQPVSPPRSQGSILNNVPMAYVNGQNVYNLFSSLSIGYQDSIDFNNMPIPFACVAVDIVGKQEVVFRSGNIVDAIRASMAIPGYFSPVRMGDKVLYDGGMLNNYPVDVVKDMGADIVIGVKLGKADEVKEQFGNNLVEVFDMTLDLYTDTKMQWALDNTDILIRPSVKGYGALSFDSESIVALMENGRQAALEQEAAIKKLKLELDECQREEDESLIGPQYRRKVYAKARMLGSDTLTIGSLSYHGLSMDKAKMFMKRTKLKPGARLPGNEIGSEIERFYNTKAFRSVNYRLKGSEEPYDLEINFRPGHNCELGLGARVDNEDVAAVMFDIGINRKALYGSSVSLSGKLSYNPKLAVSYYYALPTNAQINVRYEFAYTNTASLQRFPEYLVYMTNTADVFFSTRKFRNIYTELGAQIRNHIVRDYELGDAYRDMYDPTLDRCNYVNFYIKPDFNSLNDSYFPTKGFNLGGSFTYSTAMLYKKEYDFNPFSIAELHYRGAIGIGSHVALVPEVNARAFLGTDKPVFYANVIGGYEKGRYFDQQTPFRGFTHYRVMKPLLATGSLGVNYRVYKKHYITASGSIAADGRDLHEFVTGHKLFGAHLGYALYSPVGPLALNVHWCNDPLPGENMVGVYVSMGFSF
jgi:Predicted esterase of the alpha-beta hydrolase superfamily